MSYANPASQPKYKPARVTLPVVRVRSAREEAEIDAARALQELREWMREQKEIA